MPLCPIKWQPLKLFVKLHKSPLLISNVVKGAVSDLRQFLVIESSWKIMKNTFYFILINWICLLANQILHILSIFIKPNVLYSWSLKILAIKRSFLVSFTKILQGRHFVVVQKLSNFWQTFFSRAAFKILYCWVYCYFCVLAIKLI